MFKQIQFPSPQQAKSPKRRERTKSKSPHSPVRKRMTKNKSDGMQEEVRSPRNGRRSPRMERSRTSPKRSSPIRRMNEMNDMNEMTESEMGKTNKTSPKRLNLPRVKPKNVFADGRDDYKAHPENYIEVRTRCPGPEYKVTLQKIKN